MSLQTIQRGLVIPSLAKQSWGTSSVMIIDASGEKAAFLLIVPKAGNITKVGFRTGTVTTSQSLNITLQTVDMTTGNPTGTLYKGCTAGTVASPAADTYYEVTLGTQATAVVAGDVIAVVIEFTSTVGNLQISYVSAVDTRSFPYGASYTTSWVKVGGTVCTSLYYDDGSYPEFESFPFSTIRNLNNISTTTTPDEIALRFSLPFPARCCGFYAWVDGDEDFDVVLYEGVTAKQTVSFDKDVRASVAATMYRASFATAQALTKDTVYYLSIKPTTTTNIGVYDFTVPSAAMMDCLSGGTSFYKATRVDAGSWSDSTASRIYAGIILDQFDDGVGGGGGGPLIGGRLVL